MHYFDNAATTFPKPEEVYSYMDTFYRSYGVNVGRGQFEAASIAASLVGETRSLLLDLFHRPANREVVFAPSATEAINLIIKGLPWEDGQVVYITPFEHNAVLRTLHHISTIFNVKIEYIQPDRTTLAYDIEKLRYAFQAQKPDYVFISHASNAFGCIAPIIEICALAKTFEAVTMVDLAQTAGLLDIDLSYSNIDYAIFAGHKTLYGPFGIAGFIAKKNCSLPPLIHGGTGVDSESPLMAQDSPIRYEAGSQNIQAIAGLNAALKWLINKSIIAIRKYEKETTVQILNILKQFNNVKIFRGTNEDNHIGIISCVFNGYSSDSIGKILNEQGIAVRTGLHCAPQAHIFMDTAPAGTVRFSISYNTTADDIMALEKALEYIEING